MNQTAQNASSIKEILRDMVVEDELDEKQKETTKDAVPSSKWKRITLTCYAVLPVLILAVCIMRLQMIDFTQGNIGYGKIIMNALMLAYLLGFQSWVAYKYGDILFPRLLRLWKQTTGKIRHAFAK